MYVYIYICIRTYIRAQSPVREFALKSSLEHVFTSAQMQRCAPPPPFDRHIIHCMQRLRARLSVRSAEVLQPPPLICHFNAKNSFVEKKSNKNVGRVSRSHGLSIMMIDLTVKAMHAWYPDI